MIKLKDILKEDKYDSKKAMDFYGALQSMLLNLKQQSDPRTSDNREYFKKVHIGLQLLKATSYHNEAKKYGLEVEIVHAALKLMKKNNELSITDALWMGRKEWIK